MRTALPKQGEGTTMAALVLKYKKLTGLFIVFSIVYLLQAFLTKPDQATLDKYHISPAQALVLTLTIAIPYVLIWFVALGGYLRFRLYTDKIAKSKDGKAFGTMAEGVLWLALWLPFSAIVGNLTTQYYRSHPQATDIMVNINNYANILMLFVSFVLLSKGASGLLSLIRRPHLSMPTTGIIITICLSSIYVYLVFHDPARQFPTRDVPVAAYYLPDWAILTTIIIPRLIMWYLGARTVYILFLYRNKVKGRLYKNALENLARGLGCVVLLSIILRCFQSLTTLLSNLSIGAILLVIYALLLLIAVGYILIAKGAKSLQMIEET
jgi:hypothetical protein